ncbi:serpin family protein [Patescibacteria group bacterium]
MDPNKPNRPSEQPAKQQSPNTPPNVSPTDVSTQQTPTTPTPDTSTSTQTQPSTISTEEKLVIQEAPKPKSKVLPILIVILVLLGLSALGYWIYGKQLFKETIQTKHSSEEKLVGINSIVDANNQFAFDYYFKLKEKEGGNIFFSPFSISSALAMTYEGARNKTAEEMISVFHFPKNDNLRRTEYANVYNEINKEDKKYELKIANALWVQEDYKFLKDYLDVVEKYYAGKATNLDFVKDTENSRLTINNWVEEQTNNKIIDLIPQDALNKMTRLVLTNAIYFKGEWVKQFNKDDTKETDFRVSNNDIVKAEMMQRTDEEAKFNYYENDNLQILELPYSGEELSMLILLPKNDDLATLESLLNISKLSEWKNNLENQRVKVYIPKFKFETKYIMTGDLKEMGMPIAFSSDANFSGMDGTENLFISNVIHQAFVEVNEEGTEAAAATAVIIEYRSSVSNALEIPVFRADHPFIFIIQENASGNILFIGRVASPTLN